MIPTQDGLTSQVEEDEYHRDKTSLSQSGAKNLLPPSCPARFKYLREKPPPPKPAYTFGHAAHALVLGKGARIIEVDAPDWRGKEAQAIRKQACNGVAPMLTHELAKARAMADAVKSHPVAGPLFDEGHAELSLYHTDEATGVRLRGRLDWLRVFDDRSLIVDFKTNLTANPDEFARTTAGYFYHAQASWYMDLVRGQHISDDPRYVLVICEKEPPHLVSVVEFDVEAIAEGRRLNRQAIDTYAQCIERDEWPSYPDNDQINLISLPTWALDDELELKL